MSSTATAIADFENIVGKYKVKSDKPRNQIVETIKHVMQTQPSAFHQKHIATFLDDRAKALNTLADDYLKTTIGEKYPYVDPAIWTLKRYMKLNLAGGAPVIVQDETVQIPQEQSKAIISVPLFAWVNLSEGQNTCQLYKNELSNGSYKVKVEINAELPGLLGSNLRKAYRIALSDTYRVSSELLAEEGVGDVFAEKLDSLKADIICAWIPTVASLKVKHEVVHPPVKYDPAMFVRIKGHCFLVALWTVDDEMPLERFMREYTHGPMTNVVQGNS